MTPSNLLNILMQVEDLKFHKNIIFMKMLLELFQIIIIWDYYYRDDIISAPVPLGSERYFSKDYNIDYNNLYGIVLRFQCFGATGYRKGTYTINYKNFNMYLYHA